MQIDKTNSSFTNMKSILLFSVYLLCSILSIHAQDSIRIEGQLLHNTRLAQVVVKQFGIGEFPIGIFPIQKETGKFIISAPATLTPGVYRLQFGQTHATDYVDVILNGVDKMVQFSVDVEQEKAERVPVFTVSDENKAFYGLKQQLATMASLVMHQHNYVMYFPVTKDASFDFIQKKYAKNCQAYLKMRSKFIATTPYYWAKQMARYTDSYFPNPIEMERMQQYSAHQHFWDGKPTTDERLINSPVYTQSILNFIQYFMNPAVDFTAEEVEQGYKNGVDTIVARFSGNPVTKDFAIRYLQLGFKEIGQEAILQYIDTKYAKQLTDAKQDSLFVKRLESYQRLEAGQVAPNIKWTNALGDTLQLADLKGNEVLLVFWSSDCPHCLEDLPKVNQWAEQHKGTIVLAINVDEDKTRHFSEASNFTNFFHYNDFKGINSPVCSAYSIVATPTYFRIDKEQKIRQKYEKFTPDIN